MSGGRLLENVENAVRVAAIGVYVPPRRESNFELLAGFGVDEEFLRHRIGVVSRSVKEENERASDLCLKAFSDLQPGITHFIIHPSKDTPELRAITPDWRCRAADYQDFINEELRRHIQKIGVHVIGYRALKELMP